MKQDGAIGAVAMVAIGAAPTGFAWDRFLPVFFGLLLLLLILLLLAQLWARRRRQPPAAGPAPGFEPPTTHLTELPSARKEVTPREKTRRAFCSHCGHSVRPGAQFCGACGRPLDGTTPQVCTHCGAPLRAGARFCGRCGATVAS